MEREGTARALDEAFPVTIYHNSACGTSRSALALIRAASHEPMIVEYLKTGWTRRQLDSLLHALCAGPRDILRNKEALAAELGLLDPLVGDAAILEAMIAYPVLVERPIVVTPWGAKLARPAEAVLEVLDHGPGAR